MRRPYPRCWVGRGVRATGLQTLLFFFLSPYSTTNRVHRPSSRPLHRARREFPTSRRRLWGPQTYPRRDSTPGAAPDRDRSADAILDAGPAELQALPDRHGSEQVRPEELQRGGDPFAME